MRVAGRSGATAADVAQAAEPVSAGWAAEQTFAAMREAFARATSRTGSETRSFKVLGQSVTVIFAGVPLVPFVEPALAHLAGPTANVPALEIEIWDSATSGIDVPDRADGWWVDGSTAEPSRRQNVRTSYQRDPRILTLYNRDQRRAVVWVPDAGAVPSNEVASPLRVLLHWWARDQELQFVHAGAVSLDGRAVLLAGPSGAGKSTCALACLAHGLAYLGDDYVCVDARGGAFVHSLYSAAKLQPGQVAAFPKLRPMLTNPDRLAHEKALWFVHRDFPERIVAQARAVAVLVPRVTGQPRSSLRPIPRSTALAALAPSTIAQLSGADQWSLTAMARFLERVATYRLNAGRDLSDLAAVVRGLLEPESD